MIIFSAPSGAGKTSIVKGVLEKVHDLEFSISATSREKRKGEQDGVDYYFLSEEDFRRRVDQDEFLEWEEVYTGRLYGTLRKEVDRIWQKNKHVIFDVDVAGGVNIKKQYPEQALSIFIMPPSIQELEKRLKLRGTETAQSLEERVGKAQQELTYASEFDTILINDNLEVAIQRAIHLVQEFLKA